MVIFLLGVKMLIIDYPSFLGKATQHQARLIPGVKAIHPPAKGTAENRP